MLCGVELDFEELLKLNGIAYGWQMRVLKGIQDDDLNGVKDAFEQQEIILYQFFCDMVEEALVCGSFKVATYLKSSCQKYLRGNEEQKIIENFYKNPTPNKMRWIINILNPGFPIEAEDMYLNRKILDVMIANQLHWELQYITESNYFDIQEDIRYDAIYFLCKAQFEGRFMPYGVGPPRAQRKYPKDFSYWFRYLSLRYRTRSCEILTQVYIPIVMDLFNSWEDLKNLSFFMTIEECRCCKGSHFWDAMKLAIIKGKTGYLKGLVALGPRILRVLHPREELKAIYELSPGIRDIIRLHELCYERYKNNLSYKA